MTPTIRDVAKLAGVANGTVSRAFNGYADISPETKLKIFAAAKELGYTPNVIARSLSSKNSTSIGLIVSGLLEGDKRDNQIYRVLQGVFQYSMSHGIEVSVYATDSKNQQSKSYATFCTEHNIAGAILSGITLNDPYFHELVDSEFPCVVIDTFIDSKNYGCVSIDNFEASKEVVQYLWKNNHRKIMIIGGKKNAQVSLERIAGAYEAFQEFGVTLERDSVMDCDFSEEIAYAKTMQYLVEKGKSECTAFMCFSDIMALGVCRAIRECGYSVPDDFSVTGFDGLALTAYTHPPITTIEQDMSKIGYESAVLLQKLMKHNCKTRRIYVPYCFLQRESVRTLAGTQ